MKAVSPLSHLFITTLNMSTYTENMYEGCFSTVPLIYNNTKHEKPTLNTIHEGCLSTFTLIYNNRKHVYLH